MTDTAAKCPLIAQFMGFGGFYPYALRREKFFPIYMGVWGQKSLQHGEQARGETPNPTTWRIAQLHAEVSPMGFHPGETP